MQLEYGGGRHEFGKFLKFRNFFLFFQEMKVTVFDFLKMALFRPNFFFQFAGIPLLPLFASHRVFSRPLSSQFRILFSVSFEYSCDFRYQWIIWIGITQKGAN